MFIIMFRMLTSTNHFFSSASRFSCDFFIKWEMMFISFWSLVSCWRDFEFIVSDFSLLSEFFFIFSAFFLLLLFLDASRIFDFSRSLMLVRLATDARDIWVIRELNISCCFFFLLLSVRENEKRKLFMYWIKWIEAGIDGLLWIAWDVCLFVVFWRTL